MIKEKDEPLEFRNLQLKHLKPHLGIVTAHTSIVKRNQFFHKITQIRRWTFYLAEQKGEKIDK